MIPDQDTLRGLFRQRRRGRSLREIERECGVSAATLSRFDQGDAGLALETAEKIARWAGCFTSNDPVLALKAVLDGCWLDAARLVGELREVRREVERLLSFEASTVAAVPGVNDSDGEAA